ncbi:MAG: precorrin-8X methylmutase [Geminocystis sp.]|nr:precorrin-8X methylmutase [Geminocystis sp.]HIK38583.1 precorrin-8X methylmutase [Geminocystis sp. M7585_C2015_104]MCS7147328.1 precorrin-8X methylmutase [Geminocystis sp.]MCX8079090.1 precorrin-8X methylmutase [Geminocystis sp.]MDW8116327.1 precorrin-8X methylmutase [Geminocystis sp.]
MEWNILAAQNFNIIEQKIPKEGFSPAEYEIVRRVVYSSGDLEYAGQVKFAHQPLTAGAAALQKRVPIIVDAMAIRTEISTLLERTFVNPIACLDSVATPQKQRQELALRHPQAIYVVGKNLLWLSLLLELVKSSQISPSLIVATPAGFTRKEKISRQLKLSNIPHIRVDSSKGGISPAIAIVKGLITLAWLAYNQTMEG